MLEYLLMNKNRILSREKILSHVWEYDFEGGENIVDVYVHMLRKKIDLPGMKKLIHNVRGIGYVMRTDE
ncbi:MAG: winged helix-turn-helix domain-containing protein [Huintestinicola sp.]